jgi:hypothetical protein
MCQEVPLAKFCLQVSERYNYVSFPTTCPCEARFSSQLSTKQHTAKYMRDHVCSGDGKAATWKMMPTQLTHQLHLVLENKAFFHKSITEVSACLVYYF